MARDIYLVTKQETGRLEVIGRKENNNVLSEEIANIARIANAVQVTI